MGAPDGRARAHGGEEDPAGALRAAGRLGPAEHLHDGEGADAADHDGQGHQPKIMLLADAQSDVEHTLIREKRLGYRYLGQSQLRRHDFTELSDRELVFDR